MTLADDQKRVLLAQMAQAGSAATANYQAGQAALQQQRQEALRAAIAPSQQAGGVNDTGSLLDRRIASLAGVSQARQTDIAGRGAAYGSDLDLASQANTSRRSEIDRSAGQRRTELDREIAARKVDAESKLALFRLEREYDERTRREAAGEDRSSPMYRAKELEAQRFLDDPDGTKAARMEALRTGSAIGALFARASDSKVKEGAAEVGMDEKSDRWEVFEALLLKQGYDEDVAAELANRYRPPPPPVKQAKQGKLASFGALTAGGAAAGAFR